MKCNTFNKSDLNLSLSLTNSERITFSVFKEWEFQDFSADTFSIKYVLQGTEHYRLNNKYLPVSAGNYILVNPNQPCDVGIRAKNKVKGFCIHLEPSALNELHTQLNLTQDALIDDPSKKSVTPYFENLIFSDKENELGKFLQWMRSQFDEKKECLPIEEADIFSLLKQYLLLSHTRPEAISLNILRSSTKNELLRRVKLAKQLMDDDFASHLDIDAIAANAMLSTSHLFRIFMRVYGTTPYQYISKRRLENAAQLLSAGKSSATEAALKSGFTDLQSFSKAFKKCYGVSPNGYVNISP